MPLLDVFWGKGYDGGKRSGFMRYENMVSGRFLARPNRFVAYVEIDGKEEIVHVKNT